MTVMEKNASTNMAPYLKRSTRLHLYARSLLMFSFIEMLVVRRPRATWTAASTGASNARTLDMTVASRRVLRTRKKKTCVICHVESPLCTLSTP